MLSVTGMIELKATEFLIQNSNSQRLKPEKIKEPNVSQQKKLKNKLFRGIPYV